MLTVAQPAASRDCRGRCGTRRSEGRIRKAVRPAVTCRARSPHHMRLHGTDKRRRRPPPDDALEAPLSAVPVAFEDRFDPDHKNPDQSPYTTKLENQPLN
jgi:hypothetical protein